MKLFALEESRDFAERVASALGCPLARHEDRSFEDGEHKARPLESVRGQSVYVIQSLYGGPTLSPNDKLCRLLFFLGAMRSSGAARVIAVVPYLAYARKDRKTKARDPLTNRYVAQLIEAMGVDGVLALDVHNVAAFQNAFRCPTEHLTLRKVFAGHIAPTLPEGPVVIASPDPGGVKRAQLFRECFERLTGRETAVALMEKRRSRGVVSGTLLAGEVQGASVLVIDDLISSGGTMVRAAEACLSKGARAVYAVASHGLFTDGAAAALAGPQITKTFVSDSVPPFRLDPALVREHVEIVSAAPLVAEAIRRADSGGSIVDLLDEDR